MEVYHLQLRVVHGSFKAKIEITISSSEALCKTCSPKLVDHLRHEKSRIAKARG